VSESLKLALLRPCAHCGSPNPEHRLDLSIEEPRVMEVIACPACGVTLSAPIARSENLVSVWNTRAVTDTLLRDCLPVITVAASVFRANGIDPAGETDLLRRIHGHLGEAP
jgi:hypothetical protein